MTTHSPILKAPCFRAYDIRGVVDQDFNSEGVETLGRAIGTKIQRETGIKGHDCHVVVGYDGRHSSPSLEKSLVTGLLASGVNVIQIGCGPTPMTYFGSHHFGAHGAVMITGSHNPPTHNGFKIVIDQAALSGDDIQSLRDLIDTNNFEEGQGQSRHEAIQNEYVQRLLADYHEHYKNASDIRVAWDPGNGAAGEVIQDLLSQIDGEHFLINAEIDGDFPAHHPDPTVPENLNQLIQTVQMMDCDYGIAFDGDGDRIGVVDRNGRILMGDQLMMMYVPEVLKSHPGSPIVADVKTSQRLFSQVRELGGEPVMWKTGHSWIKKKMREIESPFGGEMSGHIFFKDRYYGFDDAIYAALRFIGCVSNLETSLSEWVDALPQIENTPEIKIPFHTQPLSKFEVIKNLQTCLRNDNVDFSDIDGVRVSTDKGWWLIRASNTEEQIMARAEAQSEKQLDLLLDDVEKYLKKAGVKDV